MQRTRKPVTNPCTLLDRPVQILTGRYIHHQGRVQRVDQGRFITVIVTHDPTGAPMPERIEHGLYVASELKRLRESK